MSNPTLINGFEDVLTFISQQAERVKKLEAENKKLKEALELANQRKMPYGWTTESCKNWMEENEELKKVNSMLSDLLQDRMLVGCIPQTTYQQVLAENEELKKKLEEEPRGYLPANVVWEVLGESEYHDLLNKRLFPECFEDDDEEE